MIIYTIECTIYHMNILGTNSQHHSMCLGRRVMEQWLPTSLGPVWEIWGSVSNSGKKMSHFLFCLEVHRRRPIRNFISEVRHSVASLHELIDLMEPISCVQYVYSIVANATCLRGTDTDFTYSIFEN